MSKPLKVLHVEDQERDVALLTRHLSRAGYALVSERVDTPEAMRAAIETREWDVILCDYSMPHFDALSALELLRGTGLEIPLIIISGTIGEEIAVEAMRAGAHDYLMKDKLARLAPAIERELHEAENRRARRRAEEALKGSEAELRALFEAMTDVVLVLDAEGRYLKIAATDPTYLYKPSANLLGKLLCEVFPKEQADFFLTHIRRALHERRTHRVEYRLQVVEKEVWFDGSVSPMTDHSVIWIARDITERKQAEERIRQSESQMAEAQQLAHVGSWNWDLAKNVLNWSDEHYHILGLDPKQFDPTYETLIAEHVFPDDRDLVRSVIDGILENHEPFSFHYRVQRPDGQVRVVHSQGSLLCDDQGSPIRMFGTAQDVTERKRAEEERERLAAEIEKQRERLDNIVGSVPGVVWEAWGQPDNATQRINFVSDYVETMLGYSVEEWLATPNFWLSIVHPDDKERAAREAAVIFSGGTSKNTQEFRWIDKDGHAIWVQANSAVITDDEGRPAGMRGVNVDITERKGAEDAIIRRASQATLRADINTALSQTDTPLSRILEHCTEALVRDLNAAFARIWTLNKEEDVLELQASSGLYTHLDGPHARVPVGVFKIGMIAAERQPHVTNEVRTDPRISDKEWAVKEGMIAFAGYPLIVEDRLIGVMAMFARQRLADDTLDALASIADIVSQGIERKRAEEALSASEEQLRQSQKLEAIGMLAGGIAHDFNNLLTVISGYSDLTLMRLSNEDPLHKNISEVRKAAERAAGLTRQLLAFSRKQVLQPRVLNLNTIISELEKMLRRLIGEDIGLRTALEPDLGSVKADPGQIEQIIMNLAVNARDAMPRGGKLTIETANVYLDEDYAKVHSAAVPGPYVMFAVSDTGTGIESQTQARIFEPFFTTKEKGKGTGLGLSTVYGIVKQSGGNIWVYSEMGQGTTFKVYLPRVDDGAQQSASAPEPESVVKGSETILLAEDEDMVRTLARQILEMHGYLVLEAANGGAALLICERHKEEIHLLITDVVMPEMSGRELADRLAQLRPEMKVLYMSGYTDNAIVHQGVLDEDANFIQKPFPTDALIRKVRSVLDAPMKPL